MSLYHVPSVTIRCQCLPLTVFSTLCEFREGGDSSVAWSEELKWIDAAFVFSAVVPYWGGYQDSQHSHGGARGIEADATQSREVESLRAADYTV